MRQTRTSIVPVNRNLHTQLSMVFKSRMHCISTIRFTHSFRNIFKLLFLRSVSLCARVCACSCVRVCVRVCARMLSTHLYECVIVCFHLSKHIQDIDTWLNNSVALMPAHDMHACLRQVLLM